MKKIIVITLLFTCQIAIGQFTIDLGSDTTYCAGNNPNIVGTNLSFNNGTAPYTFTWSISDPIIFPGGNIILYGSDFLSDTTIQNPDVTTPSGLTDSMMFFLEVIDSNGQIARDSIVIYFSTFVINLTFINLYLIAGDTFYFDYGSPISGGLGELSYLWRPNHGLIDSTSINFLAAPQYNINYYPVVTDSVGCTIVAAPFYSVYIEYLNINESLNSRTLTRI